MPLEFMIFANQGHDEAGDRNDKPQYTGCGGNSDNQNAYRRGNKDTNTGCAVSLLHRGQLEPNTAINQGADGSYPPVSYTHLAEGTRKGRTDPAFLPHAEASEPAA